MPSFDDIEKEARDHQSDVDNGVGDAEKEVDQHTSGKEQQAADKRAQELEKEL